MRNIMPEKDPYMWHIPGGFTISKPQNVLEYALMSALVAIIILILVS